MSNYATKSDAKIVTGVDTSKFANKADVGGLKSEVDLDKIKTDHADLSKLNNVVKNDFLK